MWCNGYGVGLATTQKVAGSTASHSACRHWASVNKTKQIVEQMYGQQSLPWTDRWLFSAFRLVQQVYFTILRGRGSVYPQTSLNDTPGWASCSHTRASVTRQYNLIPIYTAKSSRLLFAMPPTSARSTVSCTTVLFLLQTALTYQFLLLWVAATEFKNLRYVGISSLLISTFYESKSVQLMCRHCY